MSEVIERVANMEGELNAMQQAIRDLDSVLRHWSATRERFHEVIKYYYSEEWQADVTLSNEGKIPQEIPQGVLSEDGIYNVMAENHFLALQMIDAAMKRELYRSDE